MTHHEIPSGRDAGFTLPEMMIAVMVSALLTTVIGFTIATSLRSLPSTFERADSAIAVQGITTWLPPDVDSAEPGMLDTTPSKPSGCSGTDPGLNLLRLSWRETFAGATTTYVAAYRFVVAGGGAEIVRVACSGQIALGTPTVRPMSAKLSSTFPTVTTVDGDGDGLHDQVRFLIQTLSGEQVYIDAATKNPHETLPTVAPSPTTTVATTTTTTAPNSPPVAAPVNLTANPSLPVVVNLPASDPNGDPLTATVGAVPPGWATIVNGLQVSITPTAAVPGTYVLSYQVADPAGATASSTITVQVVTTATTTSTSTTTTTTSTTTTTVPPCVVSAMTVTPNPVRLKFPGVSRLRDDVTVTITVSGGYCVGLTLQYDTGAPNGQYVRNFGTSAPYQIALLGHPHGTELWAAGPHVLEVRDGLGNLLRQSTLTVTN